MIDTSDEKYLIIYLMEENYPCQRQAMRFSHPLLGVLKAFYYLSSFSDLQIMIKTMLK